MRETKPSQGRAVLLRKGVLAIGALLLFVAFFLPWLATPAISLFGPSGLTKMSLWNIYQLLLDSEFGSIFGSVVTQDSLMTIALVLYPIGFLAALLLLGNSNYSVAYPAGLVFVAVAAWLYDLYRQGLILTPESVTGPYVALVGGILLLASVKRYGRGHSYTR